MGEAEEAINDMKTRSSLMRELANDIFNACDKLDNLIKYLENPLAIVMSNNMKEDLDRLENEVRVATVIALNKAAVITEMFNEEGE